MRTIEADSVTEAYHRVLAVLWSEGLQVPVQAKPTREVLGLTVTIGQPLLTVPVVPGRKFNYRYMVAEAIWNLCDTNEIRITEAVHPHIGKFTEDQRAATRGRARWAYGPAIHPDLFGLVQLMRTAPGTRRAILRPGRFTRPGQIGEGTPPCLELVEYHVRDGLLHCFVHMRSNDAFMGFPYDMFAYTLWQRALAAELDLRVGVYQHTSTSMHFYEENAEEIGKVLDLGAHHFPGNSTLQHVQNVPLMGEAMDDHLLHDLEAACDMARGLRDAPPFWRCPSWAPLLETVAGRYEAGEPAFAALKAAGHGIRW